ncbi:MAG: hypothetical protein OEV79_06015 [candidate division WOR-3 bacterium]|nr:hypothetical protein [candidate division WOR-3 bacterium]
MKKHLMIVILGLLFVPLLYAGKNQAADRSTAPTARKITGTELRVKPSSRVDGPYYRPATRQSGILFVEDPAALGPPSPDQYWSAVLDSIVGSGNYGWFAVDTLQTANGPSLAIMQGYDLVIWNTYDTWNNALGPALTATDQTNISNYITGGGKVWLIGQDILWSGVSVAWMTANFELQSAIQDYNGASGAIPYPVAGVAELSGLGFSFLVDWGSDVFADALTPTANAHHVIQDVAFPSYYPSIVSNDYTTSFWTVDGRNPTPWAEWQDIVYIMLDNFGVLGAEEYVWDFEDGWQGWTHTNGGTFPAAWGVQAAALHDSLPDAGDSTMWIDSDAAGSGGGLIADTAISPAVVPPNGLEKYKWGIFHYGGGGSYLDEMDVGIKYYASSAWTTVQLVHYATGTVTGPGWDSVDVSAYAGADSIQAWFYFTDLGTWGYYAAFDNVGLYPAPVEDVGVNAIIEPVGTYSINDVVTPQAQVRNYGDLEESFPVTFTMTRNALLVYADTVMMTLASGAVDTAVFEDYTFTQGGAYSIVSYSELVGDQNPANDTVFATVSVFEWIVDFESNNGGFVADPASGAWQWGVPTSGPGAAHSGTQLWATVLAGNYSNSANWRLTSQDDYTATMNNPHILFFHWYDIEDYYDGGNVKYSTDNGSTWPLLHPVGGYDDVAYSGNSGIPAESCFTGMQATWQVEDIIIPVNVGQTFRLRFHFGTDASVYYSGWYIDDLAGIGLTYVGIAEGPGTQSIAKFGFAPTMPTITNERQPISYTITMPGHVSLKIYDRIGRLVQTLVDEHQTAGEKSLVWNGTDINNRAVANGVYFLQLEAENEVAFRKLVIVR